MPEQNGNDRKRNGLYIPWPGVSLLLTLSLAIVGPTLAFVYSNSELKAEVKILNQNVKDLNESVKGLTSRVEKASVERAKIETTIVEWKVAVDSRLDRIERRLP